MTAQPVDVGSATSRQPLGLVKTASDDPATRAWQRRPSQVSREALLAGARSRISKLLALPAGWDGYRAAPPTALAAMVANGILEFLIFDDCATPQITPGPDAGIQIDWLVNGTSVNVGVLSDGEAMLIVEEADGTAPLDDSFEFWAPDDFLLGQVKEYLTKISHDVAYRPPLG